MGAHIGRRVKSAKQGCLLFSLMTTDGNFLIQKTDDDERLVFGFAYISHDETGKPIVDQEGDFIPHVEELEKAAYDFMLDHRTGDIWHNEKVVATAIESVVFTKEKLDAWGVPEGTVPQGAWWLGWKVLDDTVWKMVKDGKLAAFSIGGRGKRTPVGVL